MSIARRSGAEHQWLDYWKRWRGARQAELQHPMRRPTKLPLESCVSRRSLASLLWLCGLWRNRLRENAAALRPQPRQSDRAVATGFFAAGKEQKSAICKALNRPLSDAGFRWISFVVSRIYSQHVSTNSVESAAHTEFLTPPLRLLPPAVRFGLGRRDVGDGLRAGPPQAKLIDRWFNHPARSSSSSIDRAGRRVQGNDRCIPTQTRRPTRRNDDRNADVGGWTVSCNSLRWSALRRLHLIHVRLLFPERAACTDCWLEWSPDPVDRLRCCVHRHAPLASRRPACR